jgi:membrane-bound serine protease (ClpP class)
LRALWNGVASKPVLVLWLQAILLLGLLSSAASPADTAKTAALLEIEGAIGPATSDYIERTLDEAAERGATLVVIRMDTPGGLDGAMRQIIKAILRSPIPVATWVAPAGARAASAGTYILYASHVAAMAPGTNLGAATPVQIGGGEPGGAGDRGDEAGSKPDEAPSGHAGMEEKLVNDAVAYIRSLADLRGRNAEWAETAVREAASLPAGEAAEKGVVDFLAADIDELLRKADGRKVKLPSGEATLQTEGLEVVPFEPSWRTRLLAIITHPTVAYLLLLIGFYGIIIEFWSPGLIGPGLVGVISLLLALYAFQLLPVNYAGLALIGAGIAMMIAEAFVGSFGVLALCGIVAFVAGSIMLVDTDIPGFAISWELIGSIALFMALSLLVMVHMAMRGQKRPVVSGREQMLHETATVVAWRDGVGEVRVHGEIWHARGPGSLAPGEHVRVKEIDGLTLVVDRTPTES